MNGPVDRLGGCACGAARLVVRGGVVAMTQCWCTDCQKETGGGPTHSIIVDADAVAIEADTLGVYKRVSDRGTSVSHRFCPKCAGVLTADVEGVPYRAVRIGTLDDRSFFRPEIVLYQDSAPAWATFPNDAHIFGTQPSAAA